jgi:hypothetical protein
MFDMVQVSQSPGLSDLYSKMTIEPHRTHKAFGRPI